MSEKTTINVHLRICADGSSYALTQYEIDEGGNTLYSVASGEFPFRDVVIAVTAPLQAEEVVPDAAVEIGAPAPAGVTAEAAA